MKILALLLIAGAAHADTGSFMSLTADIKPRQVGDLVTVIVMEDSRAGQTAQTATSRSSSIKGSGKVNVGTTALDNKVDINGGASSAGGGSTNRSAYFMARVSALVTEVLPGGNMRLAGKQLVKVNHDEQNIEVRGIARPQDISQENTVFSYNLAEADIKYDGSGVLSRRQRRGLLNFLFGWIF